MEDKKKTAKPEKSEKLLTISVAAYNVEKTIRKTLDSLLEKTPEEVLHELQVIVVNDGSKDGTQEIVHQYAERFPDTVEIIDKENHGWGSTVNASLKAARGRYFRLLDGDDWVVSENLKDYFEFLKGAEADMVLSPFIRHYVDSESPENQHKEIGPDSVGLESLQADAKIYMHETAVRTEALRRSGFQISEECFYTDNEFIFGVLEASESVQRFDKDIYVYRLDNQCQSVSPEGLKKHHRDAMKVAQGLLHKYDKHAGNTENEKSPLLEGILREVTDLAYVACLVTDSSEAREELRTFDRDLWKKSILFRRIVKGNKKIRMLRASGFLLYGFLARKMKKRYEGN